MLLSSYYYLIVEQNFCKSDRGNCYYAQDHLYAIYIHESKCLGKIMAYLMSFFSIFVTEVFLTVLPWKPGIA